LRGGFAATVYEVGGTDLAVGGSAVALFDRRENIRHRYVERAEGFRCPREQSE